MTSTTEFQEPFSGSLPICGSGGTEEFDAATLLRSLQGEVSRHTLIWVEGLAGCEGWKKSDELFHRVNETLFGHFPSKAINCLVKIFFHFLDAESPQRRLHASAWRTQNSPTTAEYNDRIRQPRPNVDDPREPLTRLVELQYPSFSSPVVADPLLGLGWIFGSLSGGGPSDESPSNTAPPVEDNNETGIDVATQTDESSSRLAFWARVSAQRSGVVRDWTVEDLFRLRQSIQSKVFDLMLDLGWRMPTYCLVIGESLLKLVSLPLPLSDVPDFPTLSEAQTSENNARFAATRLIHRLDVIYHFLLSLPSDRRRSILLIPPPATLLSTSVDSASSKLSSTRMDYVMPSTAVSDVGHLSSSQTGNRGAQSPKISPLESANDTPRELKATDDFSAAQQGSELDSMARRVHEALHTHLYFLINLLHRSPTISMTMLERDELPFDFFHKFLLLFTDARKEIESASSSSPFPPFFTSAESLGISFDLVDPSDELSDGQSNLPIEVPIPRWSVQPCKPYLLKNEAAVQAAQRIVNSNLRKSPLTYNQEAPNALSVLEKPPDLPRGSRPPEWFSCCFLGMVELLRFFELEHECLIDTKSVEEESNDPTTKPTVNISSILSTRSNGKRNRLITSSLQKDLITTALDILHYFPGLDGTLATVNDYSYH